MPLYKFGAGEIFYNQIETRPQVNFKIYDKTVYYNNKPFVSGAFTHNTTTIAGARKSGFISLYELNVDRAEGNLIYPFVTKDGSLTSFSTTSTSAFNSDFVYGDEISGSYPLSASISSDRYTSGHANKKIQALQTALNSYKILTKAYSYSSSLGDKSDQELRLISIPSIFYGSSLQKGTVSVKLYITGTLLGELRDDKKNGELRQVLASNNAAAGAVGGVVLYNEGFLILTGSWDLDSPPGIDIYKPGGSATRPRWIDALSTGSTGTNENMPSSSFELNFSGTNYVPTLTMMAQAREGQNNFTTNPTAIVSGAALTPEVLTGSTIYAEPRDKRIFSVVSSSFVNTTPPFEKTVFISQVGIYDKERNLIGIAKLAKPVRKREQDSFTFKLKLDF